MRFNCEFENHMWISSRLNSRLKNFTCDFTFEISILIKWLTYLKGPIIRDIYVSYRGPYIGLTHSYNIGKRCDLQAYLAYIYTCNIKEHWDFRCSNSHPSPPHPPNPPPPHFFPTTPLPPIFSSQHPPALCTSLSLMICKSISPL